MAGKIVWVTDQHQLHPEPAVPFLSVQDEALRPQAGAERLRRDGEKDLLPILHDIAFGIFLFRQFRGRCPVLRQVRAAVIQQGFLDARPVVFQPFQPLLDGGERGLQGPGLVLSVRQIQPDKHILPPEPAAAFIGIVAAFLQRQIPHVNPSFFLGKH